MNAINFFRGFCLLKKKARAHILKPDHMWKVLWWTLFCRALHTLTPYADADHTYTAPLAYRATKSSILIAAASCRLQRLLRARQPLSFKLGGVLRAGPHAEIAQRVVIFFGWVFFLISPGAVSPHVLRAQWGCAVRAGRLTKSN